MVPDPESNVHDVCRVSPCWPPDRLALPGFTVSGAPLVEDLELPVLDHGVLVLLAKELLLDQGVDVGRIGGGELPLKQLHRPDVLPAAEDQFLFFLALHGLVRHAGSATVMTTVITATATSSAAIAYPSARFLV